MLYFVPVFFWMLIGTCNPMVCPVHTSSGHPTAAEVEATHARYFDALSDMFRRYNARYGDQDVELVIRDAHTS